MSGTYTGVGRWEGVGWVVEKGGQLKASYTFCEGYLELLRVQEAPAIDLKKLRGSKR